MLSYPSLDYQLELPSMAQDLTIRAKALSLHHHHDCDVDRPEVDSHYCELDRSQVDSVDSKTSSPLIFQIIPLNYDEEAGVIQQ